MENISENLGLYDLFNVMVGGGVHWVCVYMVWLSIYNLYWESFKENIITGYVVGIVIVYITGMVLQELSSALDDLTFCIKYQTARGLFGIPKRMQFREAVKKKSPYCTA